MKKHYDFKNAQQGKLRRQAKALRIPIYLDDDVQKRLVAAHKRTGSDLPQLVNALLRSQIDAPELLK
jgi:hypothetical protein